MKIIVDAMKKGDILGDLFGIFFEDLNHAADGGLYAELVQNRSFEFAPIDNSSYHGLTAWEKIEEDGEARLLIETGNPVSNKNPHYLAVDVIVPGKNVGVQNVGFNTGIPLKRGEAYYFTCYAKREQDLGEPVCISLRSSKGERYTSGKLFISQEWRKYELEFTAPCTDTGARLALTVQGRGKVYFDFVSLFPKDTFMGRQNGMRRDIAEKLAELKPKFMRFPGGCLVHDGSLDANVRDSQYRWKNTIGPLEERPARRSGWGYNQTLGLGFYEYFLFCEDIGAKPVPVLPAGYDPHHHRAAPLDQLQPWIEDALDLIEFANGDGSTAWGKKRIELGHEASFHLEYIGIGNEEVGEQFFERYAIIHKAVKEKYPGIKVINTSGPFAAGGEYDRGWESARENGSDLVDEHYYCSPEWFLANHHRYDDFKKEDPKVFLGEYASWGNSYYHALAEASYMIGLERNAKAVALACYAPTLCNVDYVNWKPDLIWFNNHQVYGTANYQIQKLFMHHQGDYLLGLSIEDKPDKVILTKEPDRISGALILESNQSMLEFDDVSLTNEDTGEVLSFGSYTLNKDQTKVLANIEYLNYTVRFNARKTEGLKGFRVNFGGKDDKNKYIWELGGWQNQDNILGENINGRNSVLSQYQFTMECGRVYEYELKVTGRRMEAYIDGQAYQRITNQPVVIEPLYYSAGFEEKTGDIIIKAVNVTEKDQKAAIEIVNSELSESGLLKGKVYSMEGFELDAVNDFDNPEAVVPKERTLEVMGGTFEYEFAQHSITVLRLKSRNIKNKE